MSHEQDVIHAITLTRIGFYNMAGMLDLLRGAGSATAIMEHSADIRQLVPDASPRLVEAFRNSGDAAHRAEVEYAWAVEHGVRVLCYGSSDYPQRLNDCPDAPLVLYYKGNEALCDRAFSLLEQARAENNHIVRLWRECGLEVENAGDSQALIQLKSAYCDRRDCLRCRFGYEYLKAR